MSERLTKYLLELMRRDGYSDKVIEYLRNKVNVGRIEDRMRFWNTPVLVETL